MKKKIKHMLLLAAVVLGVTGAVASSDLLPICIKDTQYYLDEQGHYRPAGTFGYDYSCLSGLGTCTYYYRSEDNSYVPCRPGKLLMY